MSSSLLFFCPRWGSEALSWEDFMIKAKEAGYDGIEFGIDKAMQPKELKAISSLAQKCKMLLIAQQYDTYEGRFDEHYTVFENWFKKVACIQPFFVNTQTGKDHFSQEQNARLFAIANDYSAKTGIPVYHETHRNKCLFAAHTSVPYLKAYPELQITFDVSHWVCVAESLLEDQPEAIELACHHAAHIHARVGYSEGPQVTNPFLPQWEKELAAHLAWWDRIVALRRSQQLPVTITPEFGAYPYMVHLPDSGKPIADQWEINKEMMMLLKKRYAE